MKNEGTFNTSGAAAVEYRIIGGLVSIEIEDYLFSAGTLKELRKFLKKLQKQLEGKAVDE